MGPMQTRSPGGCTFAVTFIDDYSRHVTVYFMTAKSEVLSKFKIFERYVIAALEYVTRYAVPRCVTQHTVERVATFVMEDVVLRFGAFRELLTGSAPQLTGRVIELLVDMLQARQVNPVPCRPQTVALAERFHRSWKDCVTAYMADERQDDWYLWVKSAVYA
ncbi:unnamed protein product [Phytophthora fragariaefolia]|uniref:Unnamed protein product n=1 Tax=Phytophthora fragariaefolia TaxID=1490495 RepID=A0A9W6TW67_9STRA|nr:unnamed protein product [Phytophthora fragariaefolia]